MDFKNKKIKKSRIFYKGPTLEINGHLQKDRT